LSLNFGVGRPTFKYYLGWYGGGVGVYSQYDPYLKSWSMLRKEFSPSWEGPGDGRKWNSPGLLEAG
jgi:hypothetical protein